MNNPAYSTNHIGLLLFILVIFVPALYAVAKSFSAFFRFLAGWSTLTQRFPGTDAHAPGRTFKCRGDVASLRNSTYTIQIAGEGLLIRPFFAREPILIPWSRIKRVFEVKAGILGGCIGMTVDDEKTMRFFIPRELLEAMRSNIPADRIEKPQSLSDAVSDRLHGRLK